MRKIVPLFLLASVAGCGIVGPHDVTLRFDGSVTAAATGQPIPGVEVALYEPTLIIGANENNLASTTTDASGHYSLRKAVGEGCHGALFGLAVDARASGFQSTGRHVDVCTGDLQHFDFVMTASAAP